MSTTDADLPALPPKRRSFFCTKRHGHVCKSGTENAQHPQCATCGYLGFGEDCDYSDDEMHAYARAAIEADRARSQPAPSVAVPYSAIGKLLVQAIEQAVRNGANSVSMPDEYVAIAAWLDASPQPPTQQEKS